MLHTDIDEPEPRECSNCGDQWSELGPMDLEFDRDNDNEPLYCQECRTDYQLGNWQHFI